MRYIFLNYIGFSDFGLIIGISIFVVLGGFTTFLLTPNRTGISVLCLELIILLALILGYLHISQNKIADTYKVEKTEEFFIDNKQYDIIKNCLLSDRGNIKDIFKNKANSNIEKVNINIPKEIKDYSKVGEERVIKVEVYKPNTDKKYLGIDYPKEIKILKEIR